MSAECLRERLLCRGEKKPVLNLVRGLLVVWAAGAFSSCPGAPMDFSRDILPILSDKCFVCHGPDAKKDSLRLDSYEQATRDLGGYRAIDPAAPAKSQVLVRIHSAEDPMPPKEAEKSLSAKERELLTQWVKAGGRYAQHWAFVAPRKTPPPLSEGTGKVIDSFILARLAETGHSPAPEADRSTLGRRLALVLTGLPPEPDQLERFVADSAAPGAYEQLVDELLASPRYGEHQARFWLDAVRYGDTHGLHLDNRRGIYPYRDWVVQAFNENLPLDDFITWQLAGDLLPNPTLAQRVATGFIRMNPTTAEGGVLPEEFQAKNNFDRTETFGTVFLGMSLTCARCHTHKYDPIPQTEYYRLLAFFNSTAEHSLDGNAYVYGPVVKAPPTLAAWQSWQKLEVEREEMLSQARPRDPDTETALLAYAKARAGWGHDAWRVTKPASLDTAVPADWEPAKDLPGVSKEKLPQKAEARWVSFRVKAPAEQILWLTFSGGPGSEVRMNGEIIGAARPGGALLRLPEGQHEIVLKLVGMESAPPIEVHVENPWQFLSQGMEWGRCRPEDRLLMLADLQGPLAKPGRQAEALDLVYRARELQSEFTTSLVAEELPEPRPTRLLRRGEYDLPEGDPLEPGILTVMSRYPEGAPRNRLGLARWLTDREHPLVARVLVNRIWQSVFGEGLVRTPEEFGLQGQQPTHPQLLDWLAVELQENGWDMKQMIRLMVTSRTFRQSSARRPELDDPENRFWARGPSYRLDAEVLRDIGLWASGLLDPAMGGEGVKPYQPKGLWSALAHPASNTKRYVQDTGSLLYRRSLYVYWKRTSPHPMMTLFDAPSREASCVRRSRTNTSLQSLGLLNETQRLEMSRMLAQRLLRERASDPARLDRLFGLLACRPPTEGEREACLGLVREMRARYSGDESGARSLLAVGEARSDGAVDPAEHAAWTQLAVTVLASDVSILLY